MKLQTLMAQVNPSPMTAYPGRDAILESLKTAKHLQVSRKRSVAHVFKDQFVLKYGSSVTMSEAQNVKLAASIPGVRVPAFRDAWVQHSISEDETIGYVVMDYIPGATLGDVWPHLNPIARTNVFQQLSKMMTSLHGHKLIHPDPAGGGRCKGFYFTQYSAGPFESVHDMELWFNGRQRVCQRLGMIGKDEPDFTGTLGNLVMCHMDLHTENIILDQQGKIWIIDWNRAGAYPAFFEEAQLDAAPDRANYEFSQKLLKLISDEKSKDKVERLSQIGYAVTTGWRM